MKPKYKLVTMGGVSQGSEIIDLETGQPLKHVTSVDLHLAVDSTVTAEIGLLCVQVDNAEIASVSFLLFDPVRGERKTVRRIEYEDGSGLEVVHGYLMKFDGDR